MININIQRLLARLLATENISVKVGKYKTASFDIENRILRIPNWDMDKYTNEMLIAHEVGHALWTPTIEDLPVAHQTMNVFEDIRIERMIQERYPGLRHTFMRGYEWIEYRQLLNTPIVFNDQNELFKINTFAKLNNLASNPYSLPPVLHEYWKRAYTATAFEEILKISEEFEKEYPSIDLNQNPMDEYMETMTDMDTEFYDPAETTSSELTVIDTHDPTPLDMTDQIYPAIAQLGLNAHPMKMDFYRNAKRDALMLYSSFMRKKSASEYMHRDVRKTGTIDTSQLGSYKTTDSIFKDIDVVKEGKSHGIFILVDISISVDRTMMRNQLTQCLVFAIFAGLANIPFEIYTFTGSGQSRGENIDGPVTLQHISSSKWKRQRVIKTLIDFIRCSIHQGSTPIAGAVFYSEPMLKKFQADNPFEIGNLIILTDGVGNHRKSPKASLKFFKDQIIIDRKPNDNCRSPINEVLRSLSKTSWRTSIIYLSQDNISDFKMKFKSCNLPFSDRASGIIQGTSIETPTLFIQDDIISNFLFYRISDDTKRSRKSRNYLMDLISTIIS